MYKRLDFLFILENGVLLKIILKIKNGMGLKKVVSYGYYRSFAIP